jgi:putative restriction endonuclease
MSDRQIQLRYGVPWSREELILAFELYCRIPFQRTKTNNPEVQDLAELLGRTPASVARKLGNFGAFDPELRKAKIIGLTHTSKLDREIWEEFNRDWNGLVWEANKLQRSLKKEKKGQQFHTQPSGPSERIRTSKQRVHQAFFRSAILSSYEETCCITGLKIPECLIASHIVPWSEDEIYRTDPTNGLCLSSNFDRLFDAGLVTISDNLDVCMVARLIETKDQCIQELISSYNGRRIITPRRFMPSLERLRWHRRNVFRG